MDYYNGNKIGPHNFNIIPMIDLGVAMKVNITCNEGHEEVWSSSDTVGAGRLRVYLINLQIVCYSFFSGLHWTQFKVNYEI